MKTYERISVMSKTNSVYLLLGILFLLVGSLAAADIPKIIKLDEKGYKKDKKGPVLFTHQKHAKIRACVDCHHNYKDVLRKGDPVKRCSECHNPSRKEGKAIRLQYAYHKTCRNCHKKLEKAGRKTGPFKQCSGCHHAGKEASG